MTKSVSSQIQKMTSTSVEVTDSTASRPSVFQSSSQRKKSQGGVSLLRKFSTMAKSIDRRFSSLIGGRRDSDVKDYDVTEVRKHKHYKPAKQSTDFNWVSYQDTDKETTMARAGKKNNIHNINPDDVDPESSWEDLTNNNNVTWKDVNWSCDNIKYTYENIKQKIFMKWMSMIGLNATEANIKAFGSHKGVYIQNLKLTKSMKEHNVWLIHPASNFRIAFDTVTIVLTCWMVIFMPITLAFTIQKTDENGVNVADEGGKDTVSPIIHFFNMFADIWFLLDILLNFKTCSQESGKDVLTDPADIRSNYLCGWFLLDLISTIPFDIISEVSVMPQIIAQHLNLPGHIIAAVSSDSGRELGLSGSIATNTNVLKVLKFSKLIRVLKLLRIFRMLRQISIIQQLYEDQFDRLMFVMTLLKSLSLLMVIVHLFGCLHIAWALDHRKIDGIWKIIAIKNSWIDRHPSIDLTRLSGLNNLQGSLWPLHGIRGEIYIWSLFISVSHMFCIGYGMEPPKTFSEVWIATASIFFGASTYGFLVSKIVTCMQDLNAGEQIYTQKFNSLKEYLAYRNIPFELQERIYMYYEFRFQGKVFDEAKIFNELNPVLRKVVVQYNQKWLIKSCPAFEDCTEEFKDLISESLRYELYLPDDILYSEGDPATDVYFIQGGTVSIITEGEHLGRKIDGEFFGEMAMVLPEVERLSTAVCDSCSYMYELEVTVFKKICKDYPLDHAQILRYGQFRFQEEKSYYGYSQYQSFIQMQRNSDASAYHIRQSTTPSIKKSKKNSKSMRTSREVLRNKLKMEYKKRLSTYSTTTRKSSYY